MLHHNDRFFKFVIIIINDSYYNLYHVHYLCLFIKALPCLSTVVKGVEKSNIAYSLGLLGAGLLVSLQYFILYNSHSFKKIITVIF